MKSWVAVPIFFAAAFILFMFLIARTIYRCLNFDNACRSCRKTPQTTEKPKKIVRRHSIAEELKNIGPRQDSKPNKDPSFDRNISQTFDPQHPESLVLPVHGFHVPQPGEEEEHIPPGGHGVDFYVGLEGYDEPDRKGTNLQREPESPDNDVSEITNVGSGLIGDISTSDQRYSATSDPEKQNDDTAQAKDLRHSEKTNGLSDVPKTDGQQDTSLGSVHQDPISVNSDPTYAHALPDRNAQPDVDNGTPIHTPRPPSSEGDMKQKLKPTEQFGEYRELNLADVSPQSNEYASLVRDDFVADGGLENPVPVDDSDNEHTYEVQVYVV